MIASQNEDERASRPTASQALGGFFYLFILFQLLLFFYRLCYVLPLPCNDMYDNNTLTNITTANEDERGLETGRVSISGFRWVFYLVSVTIVFLQILLRAASNVYFRLRSTATTEKGPNDASGVVWALGELF
jgi:hypothetical protein